MATNYNMKSVIEDKIKNRIRNNEQKVMNAMDRFEHTLTNLNDMIVPVGTNKINFISNGTIKMVVEGHDKPFRLHRNAIEQLADKFNINTPYLMSLADGREQWQKDLCVKNINDHFNFLPNKRLLVRSVTDETRAFLSDKYRRMDSREIIKAFLIATKKHGGTIIDMHFDDLKTWVEIVHPEIVEVETANNGIAYMVFGVQLSCSDFGRGALDLRMYQEHGVCLNGMTRQSLLRQVHIGKRIEDDFMISERTHTLDTATQASLVTDIVGNVFKPESITAEVTMIKKASELTLNFDKEITNLQKVALSKGETEDLKKVLMENKIENGLSGEATLWKMVQGLTCLARDNENETRKRELQDIAGKLMERVN